MCGPKRHPTLIQHNCKFEQLGPRSQGCFALFDADEQNQPLLTASQLMNRGPTRGGPSSCVRALSLHHRAE